MSDVFLSYKAEDRQRVRALVSALEAEGLKVWWDAQIEGGAAWRHTIQDQLDAAGCVVVAWSERSVGRDGRFVQDEASRAQQRGVYVPVLIDKVSPPLGFGETQALPLVGWHGDRGDARFLALLGAIRAKLADEPHATPVAAAPRRVDRRALIAGGGVLAVGAAGAGGWMLWSRKGAGSDDKSIAVLPFANLSGDPAQAYFADGIAEELRSALARIGQMKVIARASCEAVRNAPINEAARKLGVGNILTGSVRRSPTLIRVTAQLVDGLGVERWSETYDRAPGDVLEIQTGIAENVASALRVRLGQAEKAALTVGGTRNVEAHDLFLKAVDASTADDGEAGSRKALSLLDAALALDPDYAAAHAERAGVLNTLALAYTADPAQARAALVNASEAARRAIALAPSLAASYAVMGNVLESQLDLSGALAQFQRASTLAGDDATTLRRYSAALARQGRTADAVALAARAVALDPLNTRQLGSQVLVLYYARRYAEGEVVARRVLALAPNRAQTRTVLADLLLLQGKAAEAQAELAKAPADDPFRSVGYALVAARTHDRAGFERAMATLKPFGDAVSYQIAEIYAQQGDHDRAFAALDKAWEVRDPGLTALAADPYVDPLRNDPRFKTHLARLNLPAA